MLLNYFKKIMVYVVILLFIISFFIPCGYSFVEFEKYSLIENEKTNNIPHKLNIELIINKDAYFKDYNTNNNAQVTLSIMCEWVIGYKNHGPAKTEFLVNTPCWSYNEFIDLHTGDNVTMVWYRNGEIYRSIYTGPLEWDGIGSITSGFPSILHTGSWYVKVYCNGIYLITGPSFVVIDNKPPNTPGYPNPENNAKEIDINTNLSWIGGDPDLGDNVSYDVYFGVLLPLQKVATNISISFYDPGILAVNITYFWKIVAWDNHGASTVGPLWDFTTTEELNNPPNKPSKPEGFGVGIVGRSYSYSSIAYDPNDDDIYYWFDWGDGTNSGWDGPHNSGDSVSISHIWVNGGSYPIKVKVKDIFDAESVWSDSLVINMPKSKSVIPFGFIFVFGFDVDVKIVQLEPGEDYVDLEVLSKPFYIWENEIQTRNPGEFIRLYNAKGLFSPSLRFCFGICDDWGIIG